MDLFLQPLYYLRVSCPRVHVILFLPRNTDTLSSFFSLSVGTLRVSPIFFHFREWSALPLNDFHDISSGKVVAVRDGRYARYRLLAAAIDSELFRVLPSFLPFFFFSFFFFHSRENVINESCSSDGTVRSLYRCVILLVTVQRMEEPAERRGKASALYRRFHRCLYHIARTNLIATDIITGAQRRTDRARVSWKSYVINHQGQNELAREKCHVESLASSHSALDCFRFSVRRVAENSITLSMSVAYAPIKTLLILITFHVIAPRKERCYRRQRWRVRKHRKRELAARDVRYPTFFGRRRRRRRYNIRTDATRPGSAANQTRFLEDAASSAISSINR